MPELAMEPSEPTTVVKKRERVLCLEDEDYECISYSDSQQRSKRLKEDDEDGLVQVEDSFSEILEKADASEGVLNGENRKEFEQNREELVCGVMRSLEEELGVSETSQNCEEQCLDGFCGLYDASWESSADCFTGESCPDSNIKFAQQRNECVEDGQVDIEYLFGASDDELGLVPSPGAESGVFNSGEDSSLPLVLTGSMDAPLLDNESWQYSEADWSLDNACLAEPDDQEWMKRAVASLEMVMDPVLEQSMLDPSAYLLEAGMVP